MAVLAFNMPVHPSSDLTRYYYYLDFFRGQSIVDSLRFALTQINPLHYMIMLLCSMFSNNQMYTAIITFVDYFLIIKLVGNVCDDCRLGQKHYLVGVFFILLNLNFFLVSNVTRIFFLYAVYFYCLYEESVRGKHKALCWIIYIALVFCHYAMLILIAARIFAMVMKENNSRRTLIYKITIISTVLVVGVLLINSSLGSYVISKLEDYSDYTVRGTWQTIMGVIQFAMVGAMIFSKQALHSQNIKPYKLAMIALIIFNILYISNYQMILRFGNAMIMGASPVYMCLYAQDDSLYAVKRFRIYEIISFVGTAIVFSYILFYYYQTFL